MRPPPKALIYTFLRGFQQAETRVERANGMFGNQMLDAFEKDEVFAEK